MIWRPQAKDSLAPLSMGTGLVAGGNHGSLFGLEFKEVGSARAMEVSQKPFAQKVPDQLVYLDLGSGNGGMLLSVSEEGFRFRAVTPLRPNGLVPFAFSFDGILRLNGVGEVEWLDDDAKSGGMRFADVSDEFRAALNQWLAAPSRHARSGREIAPDASTPLDSIEKI